MKALNTTPEEVLRKAIQDEIASREYYLRLAEANENQMVRRKLIELADRQVLHRARLEKRYEQVVGHLPPDPEEVKVEIPADAAQLDLPRVLKMALEHERESESNFRFLAERVPNTDLGNLFLELAEMEWNHKTEIQSEYNALLDPEQFLNDI